MSYDINLCDPVTLQPIELDSCHFMTGGTFAVGGTPLLHLNVTYNYARICCEVMGKDGIRTIYGVTGADSVKILDEAIAQLGDDVHPDYWEPTEGNVKRALYQLRAMALMRPDGVWNGD